LSNGINYRDVAIGAFAWQILNICKEMEFSASKSSKITAVNF
jgi:hypothetical protein